MARQAFISIDPKSLTVKKGNEELELSLTELRVLSVFLHKAERLVTRKEIHESVFEGRTTEFSNIVDVYVNYLRKKIGADHIKTVRGEGYIFSQAA